MITSSNITSFINFLYLRKYNVPAPAELLDKWKSVPSHEINNQLQQLYRHWNMSDQEAKNLQNAFLQSESYSPTASPPPPQSYESYNALPPPQPSYQPSGSYNPVQQKKGMNPWMIIALLLFLVLGGVGAYYAFRDNKDADPRNDGSILGNDVANNPNEQKPGEIKVDTSDVNKPVKADTSKTNMPNEATSTGTDFASVEQEKEDRMDRIYKLIYAEEDRNLDKILNSFSPAMTQYWDLKNPTKKQLTNRYMDSWQKSDDAIHKDVRMVRVAKDTYDMYATFSYYSPKDKVYKEVPVHTRYIFDNQGKIVKTYGVK